MAEKNDLKDGIASNNAVLVIISKERYSSQIFDVIRSAEEISSSKLLFVTLNQPYKSQIENLKKNNIRLDKIAFIDTLTSTVRDPEPDPDCTFVSSPSALTELSVAFSKMINDKKCDVSIFDSISTLTIYEDVNAVIKFVHTIITKSKVLQTKVVFVCLKEDKDLPLIKDLYVFVDKIIDISSY